MADDKKIKATLKNDSSKSEPKTTTGGSSVTSSTAHATNTSTDGVVASKSAEAKPSAKRGRKPGATKKSTATAKKTTAAAKKATTSAAKKATSTAKEATAATKKAVAKSNATAKKATASVKRTAKTTSVAEAPKARRKKAEAVDKTDIVKTALWKAISKAKAKKINGYVAIQVYPEGLDSFFIAVHEGQPMIERAFYEGVNRKGELFISELELLKIAQGKYDIVKAAKSGKLNFEGNLSVLLKMVDLF